MGKQKCQQAVMDSQRRQISVHHCISALHITQNGGSSSGLSVMDQRWGMVTHCGATR